MKKIIAAAIAGLILVPVSADAATPTPYEVKKEAYASKVTRKPSVLKWYKTGTNGHMSKEGSVYCFEAQNRTRHTIYVYASGSGPTSTKRKLTPWHWLIYCTDGWAEQQFSPGLNLVP